jgi:pimeloyl-ACP methyl ester carboxylesterase
MTRDFTIHYVDTREKASSRITGKTDYGVEAVARDIVRIVAHYGLRSGKYVLIGSSLGATAGIDAPFDRSRNSRCAWPWSALMPGLGCLFGAGFW